MTDTTERPLVTFAVIAYNQERFIREAIEGAFAQTYQPLEIVLSDDCSPDRTYEIMQEMAAAYDGPHKVVLNRNEPNLGLVPHVNRIFEIARGELICVNAGDDFSRNDRVKVLYTLWEANGSRHDIIHSSTYEVDENSTAAGYRSPLLNLNEGLSKTEQYAHGKQEAFGSTFAYTRRLINKFGPIPDCAEIEDRPMVFRASLAGGLLFVDEPLVSYRTGGISRAGQEAARYKTLGYSVLFGERIKLLSWRVSSAKCYLRDLSARGYEFEHVDKQYLRRFVTINEFEVKLSHASSSLGRLIMISEAFRRSYEATSFRPIKSYLKYAFWPFSSWVITQAIKLRHNKGAFSKRAAKG